MATAYLGAKFDGHDTAAFLLIPHVEEAYGLSTERLTRVKHDRLFPVCAIERIAQQAAGALRSIDRICCANSFTTHRTRVYALDKYEQDVEFRRAAMPQPSFSSFSGERVPQASDDRGTLHELMLLHMRRIFPMAKVSLRHFDHEFCHARCAYDFGPIDEALVLTMDGSGDGGVFSRAYIGRSGALTPVAFSCASERLAGPRTGEVFDSPCSLGGIYAYFTYLLGFRPNSEEGKLEALAAVGRPVGSIYRAMMRAWRVTSDLSLQVDAERLADAIRIVADTDGNLMAAPADLAATAQQFLEDVVVSYAERLLRETSARALCLSGGVFANVLLNMRMADLVRGRLHVAPAMGDEGSAQGAAAASLVADVGEGGSTAWLRRLAMPFFGTSYGRAEVVAALKRRRSSLQIDDTIADVPDAIAQRVQAGEIGALFQGRMEFGPRALGNRSILANPSDVGVKDRINTRIKRRPEFQPVCPAVLRSEQQRLFPTAYLNPHMTCAFPMAQQHRPLLPGAVHVDGTSRVQFVGSEDNLLLYLILKRMLERTGYGVILNTSFNIHGKAMVESPDDAIDDFLESGMDFLFIEGVLVLPAAYSQKSAPR